MTMVESRPDRTTTSAADRPGRRQYAAHNYSPLPVVAACAEGAWITDVEGRRYLDCLAAYSAVNFGHRHPRDHRRRPRPARRVTLVSRAFHSDRLGPFCAALAEAVRQRHGAADEQRRRGRGERHQGGPKVGRRRQGRARRPARISSSRTTTFTAARSASSASPPTRPRAAASARSLPASGRCPSVTPAPWPRAIDDNTVAVLLEPIQGEAGIIVPPDDYLPRGAGALHRTQCAVDRRRDPIRAWPAPGARSRATTGAWCPTSTCWARRWAAASCRCRPSSPTPTSSACCTPASTARRSAATRWPPPSARQWSAMLRRRRIPAPLNRTRRASARAAAGLIGHGVLAVRGLGLWAGVDVDPALGTGKHISLRAGANAVYWSRTPTARPCGSPRPWSSRHEEIDWALEQFAAALAEARSG